LACNYFLYCWVPGRSVDSVSQSNKGDSIKLVSWWSAGVTSAVATSIALDTYGHNNIDIYYCDTGKVHPDNERFIEECEEWYQKKIHIVKSEKYADPFDVARKTRYISGPAGARCTGELKKEPRYKVERENNYTGSIFGFEFTPKEINRAIRFKEQNPNPSPVFPLIDKKIDKPNALYILEKIAKIKRPAMYDLGYQNNNCIGCLKADSMSYWNKIRVDFPAIFNEMAEIERDIGASIIRRKKKGDTKKSRLYLDELDPEAGRGTPPIVPACGVVCQVEFEEIEDGRTREISLGRMNMAEVK